MTQPKRIYLDYAASTPLLPEAREAMERYWRGDFGNPGAIHREGVAAREAVECARDDVADLIGAHPDEIVFTSGGTESNILAILGMVKRYEAAHEYRINDLHLVTSAVEHSSVLEGFREYEARGARVDYIGVDERGIVDGEKLATVVTSDTFFVSIMHVNNEMGAIEPVDEIARIVRRARKSSGANASTRGPSAHVTLPPYFHTDASQGLLWLRVDVSRGGPDLLTLDGQKIYGPKGIGALYRRRGTPLGSIVRGGKQEYGLRAGTEAVPLIVGLGVAARAARRDRDVASKEVSSLRDYFLGALLREVPGIELNGDPHERLPNNVNISLPGFESEFLILALDARGIACAARSACIAGGGGSYVVRALGKDDAHALSALRFSLGKETTREDLDETVRALKHIVVSHALPSVQAPVSTHYA